MIISAPAAGDRYYLLPMLDMWTEVFTVPGTRTTGQQPASFALVSGGWRGELPQGVRGIDASIPYVWVIGRTQCNGPADFTAVHQFQDQLRLTPLSSWRQTAPPVTGTKDPTVDNSTPPLRQVDAMTPAAFFAYAAELLGTHRPHFNDYPALARMARIGVTPGQDFDQGGRAGRHRDPGEGRAGGPCPHLGAAEDARLATPRLGDEHRDDG